MIPLFVSWLAATCTHLVPTNEDTYHTDRPKAHTDMHNMEVANTRVYEGHPEPGIHPGRLTMSKYPYSCDSSGNGFRVGRPSMGRTTDCQSMRPGRSPRLRNHIFKAPGTCWLHVSDVKNPKPHGVVEFTRSDTVLDAKP